ncbi:MAG: hypothetical protein AAGI09_11780 [Pseudomonadota bacterium]
MTDFLGISGIRSPTISPARLDEEKVKDKHRKMVSEMKNDRQRAFRLLELQIIATTSSNSKYSAH